MTEVNPLEFRKKQAGNVTADETSGNTREVNEAEPSILSIKKAAPEEDRVEFEKKEEAKQNRLKAFRDFLAQKRLKAGDVLKNPTLMDQVKKYRPREVNEDDIKDFLETLDVEEKKEELNPVELNAVEMALLDKGWTALAVMEDPERNLQKLKDRMKSMYPKIYLSDAKLMEYIKVLATGKKYKLKIKG